MVAAMARARNLINRTTSSRVTQDSTMPSNNTISVPTHVARLASKWELAAYSVKPDDVHIEIMARGPVVACVHVNDALLELVSQQMHGTPPVPSTPYGNNHGTVIVAILGWEEHNWVVALPWGKYPEMGWDGTVLLPRGTELNVCAMAKQEDVSPHRNGIEDAVQVVVLPPNWNPPTTQPLPAVAHVGTATGKEKRLKQLHRSHQANGGGIKKKVRVMQTLNAWMTDDNMNVTIQCAVTVVIIIVGILTLILMRRCPRVQC